MLKKIICLCLSFVLSCSFFISAYADESRSLKDVCENEETFKAIESMKDSDELELYIILSYPEAEKLSYSLQNVTEEEFQAKINELCEMYKSFCEEFVKNYSLKAATLCPFSAMVISKLTLDQIECIMKDESFAGFSLTEIGVENDKVSNDTEKSPTDVEIILGDVDGDDLVTMLDVTTLQKIIACIYKFESESEKIVIINNADVNRDNNCDMIDVVLIQRIIAKL